MKMFGGIGIGELMVILLVFLLLFGAKRLPEIARSLGSGIFEFKKAMNSNLNEIRKVMDEEMPPPRGEDSPPRRKPGAAA